MTLGSEFTFHKSLGERTPSEMLYQLKHGSKWETLVTVQPHMVDKVKALLNPSNEGKTWRFSKPAAPRKAQPRKRASTPESAEESVK